MHLGVKYMHSDYILLRWQENDLPVFGRIVDIVVISSSALFEVTPYIAYGIDRHFHSFVIQRGGETEYHWLLDLCHFETFRAHSKDGSLFITFHSHIENYGQ